MTPASEVDAPCATPRDVHVSSRGLALICEGDLVSLDGPEWVWSGYSNVKAQTVANEGTIVASQDSSCEGLILSLEPALPTGNCVTFAYTDGPVALAYSSGEAWIWAGDSLVSRIGIG